MENNDNNNSTNNNDLLNLYRFFTGCTDTSNWNDGQGNGCDDYSKYGCENGAFKNNWNGGIYYNYPEQNCCACGKKGK